jgi:hypothetical protein
MKKKLLAGLLLAGGTIFAAPRGEFSFGYGSAPVENYVPSVSASYHSGDGDVYQRFDRDDRGWRDDDHRDNDRRDGWRDDDRRSSERFDGNRSDRDHFDGGDNHEGYFRR